jgi:predicted PurR-regulated permease PerM
MVIHDLVDLIQDLPRLIDNLSAWLHNHFGVEVPDDWRAYLKSDEVRNAFSDAVGPLSEGAQAAVTGLLHLLAFLGEMLLIPVFAFYFLADWDALLRRIKHLVPPRRRAVVDTAVEIDRVIAGWVRGQGIVVICLMILYAVAFEVLGVPGGMPLGLIVGGLTVMLASSAATSVWLGAGIVFLVLHLLEAAVLTPKIVGHRVGLSESAALFAVVAGGKLLGFVGVVLAVPLAATVNVLLRKLVSYYERTEFFGEEADAHVAVSPAMAMILPVEPTVSVAAVTEPETSTPSEPSE